MEIPPPSVVYRMSAVAPALRQSASGLVRRPVRRPNHGVYLNRPSLDIDPRGLEDCLNVRLRDGRISSDGMGWENFPFLASSPINLDDLRVLLIDEYRSRSGSTTLILCNNDDVFRYDTGTEAVLYLTPIYATGTASMAGGGDKTVTGIGTAWKTAKTTTPSAGGYGNNVRPGDFISFGANDENDPAATWYEIDSVTDDTHLELFVDPGVIGAAAYTIRQTLTGDNNDIFNSAIFQDALDSTPAGLDVYYLTNGVEMLEWDGSSEQMDWFYPGFVAKNLLTFRQTLIVWDVLEGSQNKPGVFKYSDTGYPRNFATGAADEITPSDGVRDLMQVIPLGDQAALYYQDNIILGQEVGAPVYFVFRVAVPGVGLVAPKAIMDQGDYHEFLSREGAYKFNGVGIKESMSQVFREVLRTAAPNRIRNAYAEIDEEMGEVVWSVPLTTDGSDEDQAPTRAYTQHYLEDLGQYLPDPVMIRDFPFTAVGSFQSSSAMQFDDFPESADGQFDTSALRWDDRELAGSFPFKLAGDDAGNIYILNTSNTKAGAALDSWAQFPRRALGDGELLGLVHRIEPYTTRRQGAGYELLVTLYAYDFADGDVVATTALGFDLSHGGLRYVPFRKAGRFGSVRFGTAGLTAGGQAEPQPWDSAGYEVAVSPMGSR
jgi:hypothetical protein